MERGSIRDIGDCKKELKLVCLEEATQRWIYPEWGIFALVVPSPRYFLRVHSLCLGGRRIRSEEIICIASDAFIRLVREIPIRFPTLDDLFRKELQAVLFHRRSLLEKIKYDFSSSHELVFIGSLPSDSEVRGLS